MGAALGSPEPPPRLRHVGKANKDVLVSALLEAQEGGNQCLVNGKRENRSGKTVCLQDVEGLVNSTGRCRGSCTPEPAPAQECPPHGSPPRLRASKGLASPPKAAPAPHAGPAPLDPLRLPAAWVALSLQVPACRMGPLASLAVSRPGALATLTTWAWLFPGRAGLAPWRKGSELVSDTPEGVIQIEKGRNGHLGWGAAYVNKGQGMGSAVATDSKGQHAGRDRKLGVAGGGEEGGGEEWEVGIGIKELEGLHPPCAQAQLASKGPKNTQQGDCLSPRRLQMGN